MPQAIFEAAVKEREMPDLRVTNLLWSNAQVRARRSREVVKQTFDRGYRSEFVVGNTDGQDRRSHDPALRDHAAKFNIFTGKFAAPIGFLEARLAAAP